MKNVSFKFIVSIIAFVLLVVFAVQNSASGTIKFLFWQFQTPEAVIIIVSAALGALIGFLVFMMKYLKQGKTNKTDQKALSEALAKNTAYEAQIADLKAQIANDLSKSLDVDSTATTKIVESNPEETLQNQVEITEESSKEMPENTKA